LHVDLSLRTADGSAPPPPLDQLVADCEPANTPFQEGDMRLRPQQMSFGHVLSGTQTTRTIVLENRSHAFEIPSMTITGQNADAFSHSRHCSSSQRLCVLEVTYAPTVPGRDQVVLKVNTIT